MSLQDDYFDLAAKLEGTPEAKQFHRIWNTFCHYEAALEEQGSTEADIALVKILLRSLELKKRGN